MNSYILNDNIDRINLLGRAVQDDGKIKAEMTVSGFEFEADFGGDIKVSFDYFSNDEPGLLGAMIDGDFDGQLMHMVNPDNKSCEFGLSLPRGRHRVKILKLNEYVCNQFHFKCLELDGELLKRPTAPALRIEFYGDSMTCGYGNLSPDRNKPIPISTTEHGNKTYAALLANQLGAQLSVAAASGYGLYYSYGGQRENTYRAFWDYSLPSEKKKWDFSKYKADMVFVNLGANDAGYTGNSGTDVSFETLYHEIKTLFDGIRSHNPDCKLIVVLGAMGMPKNEHIDVPVVYEKICAEYDNAYYITVPQTKQRGGDWHPSVEDHVDFFNTLYEALKKQSII